MTSPFGEQYKLGHPHGCPLARRWERWYAHPVNQRLMTEAAEDHLGEMVEALKVWRV